MSCRRCPHHVRHGRAAANGRSIEFRELCGLKMKSPGLAGSGNDHCVRHPFPSNFDYFHCEVYLATFKSGEQRNDVMPTSDIQYSDAFNSGSITDMELL